LDILSKTQKELSHDLIDSLETQKRMMTYIKIWKIYLFKISPYILKNFVS